MNDIREEAKIEIEQMYKNRAKKLEDVSRFSNLTDAIKEMKNLELNSNLKTVYEIFKKDNYYVVLELNLWEDAEQNGYQQIDPWDIAFDQTDDIRMIEDSMISDIDMLESPKFDLGFSIYTNEPITEVDNLKNEVLIPNNEEISFENYTSTVDAPIEMNIPQYEESKKESFIPNNEEVSFENYTSTVDVPVEISIPQYEDSKESLVSLANSNEMPVEITIPTYNNFKNEQSEKYITIEEEPIEITIPIYEEKIVEEKVAPSIEEVKEYEEYDAKEEFKNLDEEVVTIPSDLDIPVVIDEVSYESSLKACTNEEINQIVKNRFKFNFYIFYGYETEVENEVYLYVDDYKVVYMSKGDIQASLVLENNSDFIEKVKTIIIENLPTKDDYIEILELSSKFYNLKTEIKPYFEIQLEGINIKIPFASDSSWAIKLRNLIYDLLEEII